MTLMKQEVSFSENANNAISYLKLITIVCSVLAHMYYKHTLDHTT